MQRAVSFFRFQRIVSCIGVLIFPLLLHLPAAATQPDWDTIEQEAAQLLSRYIQIDTTNPPGNETAAAQFWQDLLAKEGLAAQVYESQPGRGIVYARLKGSGEKKPLILLHHMDVVPAQADNWDVDPFSGTIKDGQVYGRGAIDCKGTAASGKG